ncbi:MAG: hypothetical protein GY702_09565 [Desulfobulbaceae bacterium]|nr:hypothetical protein [Desulfobulbaceae bacterium]
MENLKFTLSITLTIVVMGANVVIAADESPAGGTDCRPVIILMPNSNSKCTGDAEASDVLAGTTFSSEAGTGIAGAMV